MSFSDPIVLTYNSASKSLVKVNQDNRGAEYFLDDGVNKFTLAIKHQITPKTSKTGESHLARLDVERFSAEGIYLRTDSIWVSIRTNDSQQVTADMQLAADAFLTFATSANVGKLLAREN